MGGRLHVREECKLRRAQCVSGEVASLQGRPGQCAAASAASCMRLARVQSLTPCNHISVLHAPTGGEFSQNSLWGRSRQCAAALAASCMRFSRVQSLLTPCNHIASLSRVGGSVGMYRWLHKREECKLRRAQCVSGEVASLQCCRPGQCAAASVASCMRSARVQSLLTPCNHIASLSRVGGSVGTDGCTSGRNASSGEPAAYQARWHRSRVGLDSVQPPQYQAVCDLLAFSRRRSAIAWHPCQG